MAIRFVTGGGSKQNRLQMNTKSITFIHNKCMHNIYVHYICTYTYKHMH